VAKNLHSIMNKTADEDYMELKEEECECSLVKK
jgi:hypothetical protein